MTNKKLKLVSTFWTKAKGSSANNSCNVFPGFTNTIHTLNEGGKISSLNRIYKQHLYQGMVCLLILFAPEGD